MKILIAILVSLIGFASCKSEQKSNPIQSTKDIVEKENSIEPIIKNDTVVKFFPAQKEVVKKDTLIEDRNIQISITSKALDSYVVNQFISGQTTNIHKYRDFENHLIIKKDSVTIIDTILRKQNFIQNTGADFQEISVFHGYWFNKIEDNQIELFGMISKPETDYTYTFQHFFDITTGTFEIKNSIDEDY